MHSQPRNPQKLGDGPNEILPCGLRRDQALPREAGGGGGHSDTLTPLPGRYQGDPPGAAGHVGKVASKAQERQCLDHLLK